MVWNLESKGGTIQYPSWAYHLKMYTQKMLLQKPAYWPQQVLAVIKISFSSINPGSKIKKILRPGFSSEFRISDIISRNHNQSLKNYFKLSTYRKKPFFWIIFSKSAFCQKACFPDNGTSKKLKVMNYGPLYQLTSDRMSKRRIPFTRKQN